MLLFKVRKEWLTWRKSCQRWACILQRSGLWVPPGLSPCVSYSESAGSTPAERKRRAVNCEGKQGLTEFQMYNLERHSSAGMMQTNIELEVSPQLTVSQSCKRVFLCVTTFVLQIPVVSDRLQNFWIYLPRCPLSLKEGTSVSPWPAPAECLRSPCRSHWTRCSWAQRWMSRWQWDQDCSRWWGGCCNSWTWWKALGSCPQTLRCHPPWSGQRVYRGIQERSQRCVHVVR